MKKDALQKIIDIIEIGRRLTLAQTEEMLNVDPQKEEENFRNIVHSSRKLKAKLFSEKIFTIVPLYVTSICQEHCIYCNYRAENKYQEIERLRLSDEELQKEIHFLASQGLRVIELVYATDPNFKLSHIIHHIKLTHRVLDEYGGGVVGINSRPYSTQEYEKLKSAGLEFSVLWQECYDESRYKELHQGDTEKTNYDYRIEAQQRMIDGGITSVGFGVLSGLHEWRKEWFALFNHVQSILDKNKDSILSIILGIPRLKPAAGALLQRTDYVPTDKEYLLAISVFNLLFPTALPFINTRENWELCLEIAKGGGALFTFNCRTIPGGYSLGRQGYQFPTNDFRIDEYTKKLNGSGLQVVNNWNFQSINTMLTRKENI